MNYTKIYPYFVIYLIPCVLVCPLCFNEQMDAAAKGFDWTTEWFEAAGINPEDPPSADKSSEE